MKKLIVYWGTEDEADLQIPKKFQWEDSSAATIDDYRRVQHCTQTSFNTENGMVTVISPDEVATAKYDVFRNRWFLEAPGGGPFYIQQSDPNASDDELQQEILMYPVAYKAVIDRSHVKTLSIIN
jgi:hypothetical protein